MKTAVTIYAYRKTPSYYELRKVAKGTFGKYVYSSWSTVHISSPVCTFFRRGHNTAVIHQNYNSLSTTEVGQKTQYSMRYSYQSPRWNSVMAITTAPGTLQTFFKTRRDWMVPKTTLWRLALFLLISLSVLSNSYSGMGAACSIGKKGSAFRMFVGKPEGYRRLGRSRHKMER